MSLVSTFIHAENEVPGFGPTQNSHVYNRVKCSPSITDTFLSLLLLPDLVSGYFIK